MPDAPLAVDIQKFADQIENSGERVSWKLGKIANAKIAQAKQAAPASAILREVDPFEATADGRYVDDASAATIATILRQVAGEIPKLSPSMPAAAPRESIMGDIAHKQW